VYTYISYDRQRFFRIWRKDQLDEMYKNHTGIFTFGFIAILCALFIGSMGNGSGQSDTRYYGNQSDSSNNPTNMTLQNSAAFNPMEINTLEGLNEYALGFVISGSLISYGTNCITSFSEYKAGMGVLNKPQLTTEDLWQAFGHFQQAHALTPLQSGTA